MIFAESQAADIARRTEAADVRLDKYFAGKRRRNAPPEPEPPAAQPPTRVNTVIMHPGRRRTIRVVLGPICARQW